MTVKKFIKNQLLNSNLNGHEMTKVAVISHYGNSKYYNYYCKKCGQRLVFDVRGKNDIFYVLDTTIKYLCKGE